MLPFADGRRLDADNSRRFGLRAEMLNQVVISHRPILGTPKPTVNRHTLGRGVHHSGGMIYDGGKITSLREAKRWTMAELARQSGLSEPSIWALEHHVTKKPKYETLTAIAAALGVPVREITKPSKRGVADALDDLKEIFDHLDAKHRDILVATARTLLNSQKK